MAVMTLEHLVLRGIRALGAEAQLKRIGANPVMERTSAMVSFTRRQSQRFNYPSAAKCDPRDCRAAVRAGRPGSASPVSGSPASILRLAGRWCLGHATGKPAIPVCRMHRGRPDSVQVPSAGWIGRLGRIHAGSRGDTAVSGAFKASLRGKGAR